MTVPAQSHPYDTDTDIGPAAALIADPTRLAGVSAATASFHLAKLLEGGMIAVARQGRHRYYRLAGHEVAAAIEALGLSKSPGPGRRR